MRAGSWLGFAGATVVAPPALAQLALEAPEIPAVTCRGDACAEMPADARKPLLVAVDPARPSPPTPPPSPPPSRHSSVDAAGPRLTFGRTFSPGVAEGFYGRFDAELFTVFRPGPGMLAIRVGLEGWGSVHGGGGGIPWSLDGGAAIPFMSTPKSPRFVVAGGLGWEWAYYDRIKHVGQFGILAPLASAYLGVDFRGIRLFGEGSAQYRWGWGDVDRAHYRVGASLSLDSELWDGVSN